VATKYSRYNYDPFPEVEQERKEAAKRQRVATYPPLTDIQRIARHYGISISEACEWLKYHTVDELLPERGTGAETGSRRPRPRSAVNQGTPTGNFTYPYVEVEGHPDNVVPVGEQIRLRAYYEAHCPGQTWYAPAWTVSVKAKGDGIAVKNDTTHWTEGPVTGNPLLNSPSLPIMPNNPVTLEVTLWGNPDAFQELPLEDP